MGGTKYVYLNLYFHTNTVIVENFYKILHTKHMISL